MWFLQRCRPSKKKERRVFLGVFQVLLISFLTTMLHLSVSFFLHTYSTLHAVASHSLGCLHLRNCPRKISYSSSVRQCFSTLSVPVCVTSRSASLSTNLTILLSHHHMGLTAQVNENLKWRRAPHMMPENSVYYSCTQTRPSLSYSKEKLCNLL